MRLAQRLNDRNDCDQVRAGERIQYIMVNDKSEIETPKYVAQHGMPVDVYAYFEKQLKTPIDTLWSLLLDPNVIYSDIIAAHKKRVRKTNDLQGFLKLFHKHN